MRPIYFPGSFSGCLILTAMLLTGCGGGDGDGASTGNADAPGNPGSGGSSNVAPTVTGTPGATAVAGQAYSFQPSAADANGDRLSFSVANLPGWATFSNDTGRITGTPTAAQVGSYANITITVSDGTASATLAPFSITVNAEGAGGGTAALTWTAPTENTNGSSLSNLAGYQVKYGRSANNLDRTVSLDNPSLNRYTLENLSSGTWYFAVVAVTSGGVVSEPSNTASKTVS
jgi:hypothetical protein